MEVLELNRPLETVETGILWVVATGKKEVKFDCFTEVGRFKCSQHKIESTVDFRAVCHDVTPPADKLYVINFAMPVSQLLIETRFTGSINLEPQILLDLTKSNRSVTRVTFKSPFPLCNFKLTLKYIFDTLANPWSRFDYEYFASNKVLAPYYSVSVLHSEVREPLQLALRNQGHLDVTMVVTSSDKMTTEETTKLRVQ